MSVPFGQRNYIVTITDAGGATRTDWHKTTGAEPKPGEIIELAGGGEATVVNVTRPAEPAGTTGTIEARTYTAR